MYHVLEFPSFAGLNHIPLRKWTSDLSPGCTVCILLSLTTACERVMSSGGFVQMKTLRLREDSFLFEVAQLESVQTIGLWSLN
jgi:hypothetical protein